MNLKSDSNILIKQFDHGFTLLLPFDDRRDDKSAPLNDPTAPDTWEVRIVKPDGTSVVKTSPAFPDDTKSIVSVTIDPLDLDQKGTYYYEVVKTTSGNEFKSATLTFQVSASLPVGLPLAPASSPNEFYFPYYNAQGALTVSPLKDNNGILEYNGVPVSGGGGGSSVWGGITGTLSDQTDLQTVLDGKSATGHNHVEADITDLDKYTQAEVDSALSGKEDSLGFTPENTANKGQVNGYAGLDGNGQLDPSTIPTLKSHEFSVVADQTARLALTASQVQVGDEAFQQDTSETYKLIAADPAQLASWQKIADTTPDWSAIANKPSTFTPSAHNHASSEITDFTAGVSSNPNVSANTAARHTHANQTVLDNLTDAGAGTQYLADDGTYKTVTGGGSGAATSIQTGSTLPGTCSVGDVFMLDSGGSYECTAINTWSEKALADSGGSAAGQMIIRNQANDGFTLKNQPTQAKSISIEQPTNAEDISLFFTPTSITVTKLVSVLKGSATPSVTYTIRHAADRNAAGSEVVTAGTATSSTTAGDTVTSFNSGTIPADSFVWLETTASSGTVDEFNLTIIYTEN